MSDLDFYIDLLENSEGDVTFDIIPDKYKEDACKLLNEKGYSYSAENINIDEINEKNKALMPTATASASNVRMTIEGTKITEKYLSINPNSRPGKPIPQGVKKIAIHYVGNPGSSAMGNRNYFENLKGSKYYASSHYIVGLNGEIIQCIPENEIAYCTNSANNYSISIENCHPKSDGKFNTSTYNSLVALCVDLCYRYKLSPLTDLIRHYDVTGKQCPLYWVKNSSDWNLFKSEVDKRLKEYYSKLEYKNKKEEQEMLKTKIINVEGLDKSFTVNEIEGKNYFPAEVLRELGINVDYNQNTKKVTLSKETKNINIQIDGKNKTITSVNIKGYNYVPLRTMELMGASVSYDAQTKTPIINTDIKLP